MKGVDLDSGKDCTGNSSEMHWEHSPQDEEDLIAVLRRKQVQYPIRAVLAALGAVLVSAGTSMAVFRLLRAHPYLPIIGLGLVCLIAASATCNEGLVVYLPAPVQHYLLKVTLFDLLHDDANFLNFMRKWVRLLMVCYARSPGEIENLTRGLDPEFLDMVFNHTMIDWLPISVRRLLLPERPIENGDASEQHCDHHEQPAQTNCSVAISAARATVRVKQVQQKGKADTNVEDVTHHAVWNGLCARRQEVMSRYVEPELMPVITRAIMQSIWCMPVLRLLPSSHFCQMASAAAASFWWGTGALIWYLPSARSLVFHSFARAGLSNGKRELHLLRASRFANLLGVLSIGITIASLSYRRFLADFQEKREQQLQE